jgi:hypothetical protein
MGAIEYHPNNPWKLYSYAGDEYAGRCVLGCEADCEKQIPQSVENIRNENKEGNDWRRRWFFATRGSPVRSTVTSTNCIPGPRSVKQLGISKGTAQRAVVSLPKNPVAIAPVIP